MKHPPQPGASPAPDTPIQQAAAVRRGLLARRLALAGLAALLILGLAEALAWLLPLRHPMDNPWYLSNTGDPGATAELPFTRPARLFWKGLSRGDLAILNDSPDPYARRLTFQTDFEGFRNTTDKSRADLVLLGDSFTEAGNVPESETFAARSAARLGVSWRNLGRAGYSTPAELVVLRRHGLPCRPRAVVWQIAEPNDLAEAFAFELWLASGKPRYFGEPTPTLALRADTWRRRSPTHRLFAALFRNDSADWSFRGRFRDASGSEHDLWFLLEPGLEFPATDHPGWPAFADALTQGAGLCRSNGIHLLVLFIPSKFRVMGPFTRLPADVAAQAQSLPGLPESNALAPRLRALCDSLSIPFADATAPLTKEAAAGGLVYLPRDTHLAPFGHEVVADMIVE
jgi:hypothetical protein